MSEAFREFHIDNKIVLFGKSESIPINCAYHKNEQASHLFVTFAGVDGSHNGYNNKYLLMAKHIQENSESSVLRASNPYILSHFWDTNFKSIMDYIDSNLRRYNEISVFGFSAGASIVAKLAHKYPKIKKIILCSMAKELDPIGIKEGLTKFSGKTEIFYGDKDPNHEFISEVEKLNLPIKVTLFKDYDHYFSDKHFEAFVKLPFF